MNSKILRNSILAVALALVAVPAQAQLGAGFAGASLLKPGASGSYESEINRYIQSQNLRGNVVKMFKTMMSQFIDQGVMKISPSQLNAMAEEFADVSMPIMTKSVGDCVRQNLSLDELRQINAFCETPVGRKLIALQPTFMEAGTKAMQQPEIQMKIQQIMQRYIGK